MLTYSVLMQRAAAERVLRQLQEHPDTWTRVVTILQNSTLANSKFYALQVRVKLQHLIDCTSKFSAGTLVIGVEGEFI